MSSRTEYERALSRELTAVGISGQLRRRILDEIGDHLSCDPEASLGNPRALAGDFADVVGTARVKTAALAASASLVVAGLLFAVAFVAAPNGLLRAAQRAASQGFAPVPAAEASIILRRAAVGVGAGIVSMLGLGVIELAARHQLGAASGNVGLIAAGVGLVALLASLPSLGAAARVRPTTAGAAGDIFDDLGPLAPAGLRGRPWRCAVLFSVVVAALITLAAIPAQDVYDGALRGMLDAVMCLVGFATLGRYLGLWRRGDPADSVSA